VVKKYKVRVTVYHGFEVEADNEEDAREAAIGEPWELVKHCIIDIEEKEDAL
jgi:hypothetical protein